MAATESVPFGALLQRYRVTAGLSQAALAERARLSARAVSALERGLRRHPYLRTVQLLAEALDLTTEQRAALLAAAQPERGTDPQRREKPALPGPATPLLGRDGQVEAVAAMLTAGRARLVTLTGPAGVGKTRLALAVTDRLQELFADEVTLVELASVRDAALVVAAIAHTLGVGDAGDQPLPATLRQHLAPRRLLLVLDNFEQVLPAGAILADLLAACPELTLLVTSREPLHLQWEREWAVPPLALPAREHRGVDEIAQSPAVALFVERARAVVSSFQLGLANAGAIADICVQLDGLPLAIELAAARSKLLSPDAIRARLGDRLTLLTGEMRDVPARHQTLREAIAWSYDILDDDEREFFRRLAVFAGGFTLDGALAVAGVRGNGSARVRECRSGEPSPRAPIPPYSRTPTLDRLAALVDKNLLVVETQADGEPRFQMLETIRAFGVEQLAECGELEATRQGHARYFLALAEQAEPRLVEADQKLWLDRMEAERGNLRAALGWAEATAEGVELGLRLLTALLNFWYIRGHFGEGRTWLERLLDRCVGAAIAPTTWARATSLLGLLAVCQGDYAMSAGRCKEGADLLRTLADEGGLADGLVIQAMVAYEEDDYRAARAFAQEGLALARKIGDDRTAAVAQSQLGMLAYRASEYDLSRALNLDSLRIFRARNDAWGVALALRMLGAVAHRQGEHQLARSRYEEGLAVSRDLGDRSAVAQALVGLGHLERSVGDLTAAANCYEESLRVCREIGVRRGASVALGNLGIIAEQGGSMTLAQQRYEESLAIARAAADRRGVAATSERLANLAQSLGDPERSRQGYADSLRLWLQMGDRRAIARCLTGCARLIGPKQPARALFCFAAATAARERLHAPLPLTEQAAVDQEIALLRSRLGERASERAVRQGRELDLDSAIAAALNVLAAPLTLPVASPLPFVARPKQAAAPLSPREREVALLIAQGRTNREIAEQLVIAERTADTHVTNILNKLGLNSRAQVAAWTVARGMTLSNGQPT